jgi:hypothetical protein
MGGLKGEAITLGAHRTCMAAGRSAACDPCLAIVDRIIDSKRRARDAHAPAGPAAAAAPYAAPVPAGRRLSTTSPSW